MVCKGSASSQAATKPQATTGEDPQKHLVEITKIGICFSFLKMKLWTFLPFLFWLLVLNLAVGSECGAPRRTGRSKRDLVRVRDARNSFQGACATRLPRGKRSLPGMDRRLLRQHHRSSQPAESSPSRGKAVYFTGKRDQLRLKPSTEIPRGNFTLEMWIKPEGGQRSPAVIAGMCCQLKVTLSGY